MAIFQISGGRATPKNFGPPGKPRNIEKIQKHFTQVKVSTLFIVQATAKSKFAKNVTP